MNSNPYRGRLAPSPTGALHLGNIRTFLITWLHCRFHQGELVMRMEDLNIERLKEGAVESIYEDLIWLGFDWDIGAGLHHLDTTKREDPSFIQSNCTEEYEKVFETLKREKAIYPCSCTRKELSQIQSAPHEHEQFYPNICRDHWPDELSAEKSKGHTISWRYKLNDDIDSFNDGFYGNYSHPLSKWSGDFVIAQKSNKVAYQLAVVIDDSRQGISKVIRADDLLDSTLRQIALYKKLTLTAPQFHHIPLVVGEDGKRLAKRHGDYKISSLRKMGIKANKILGYLAYTCGWLNQIEELSIQDCLSIFDYTKVPKNKIVVKSIEETLLN